MAVVYLEADDLQAAFAGIGSSQEPFDNWFRDLIREVHGIDLAQGFPTQSARWSLPARNAIDRAQPMKAMMGDSSRG